AYPKDRAPRLFVQYVPHAFGYRAMNVPFVAWLGLRKRGPLWVMFHEVAFPLERGQRARHQVLGVATHAMAAVLSARADRVFVSTSSWNAVLARVGRREPATWLPIPTTLATEVDS